MRLLITLTFLFTCYASPSSAILFYHEDGTPVQEEELRDGRIAHPDVCRIVYHAEKNENNGFSSAGTGIFLSPNVILTARHVVCQKEPMDDKGATIRTPSFLNMVKPAKAITVQIHDSVLNVKEVKLFEEGHEDFALLILEAAYDKLDKFRKVRATCLGEDINSVSVMGYGLGRVVSQTDRVHADYDDAHLIKPQLRYRNDLKPHEAEHFKIETNYFMACYYGKAQTYSYTRPYPKFNLLSKHVRMMSGDSGSPVLDDQGYIFGVCAYAQAKFIDEEREVESKYYELIYDTLPLAYNFVTRSGALALSGCALTAYYFCGSMPLLNTLTVLALTNSFLGHDETPLSRHAKPWLENRIKAKNYVRLWGQRNKMIRSSIVDEKKYFSSTYECFREDVVHWINRTIEENKL